MVDFSKQGLGRKGEGDVCVVEGMSHEDLRHRVFLCSHGVVLSERINAPIASSRTVSGVAALPVFLISKL
jgi:hypothetical protein